MTLIALLSLVAALIALAVSVQTYREGRSLIKISHDVAREATHLRHDWERMSDVVAFGKALRVHAFDFGGYLEQATALYKDSDVEHLVIYVKRWTSEEAAGEREKVRAGKLREAIVGSAAEEILLLGDAASPESIGGLIWRLFVVGRGNLERGEKELAPIRLWHIPEEVPGFMWYRKKEGESKIFLMREVEGEAVVVAFESAEHADFVNRCQKGLLTGFDLTDSPEGGIEEAWRTVAAGCKKLIGLRIEEGSDEEIRDFARLLADRVESEDRRADLSVTVAQYLMELRSRKGEEWDVWLGD